MHRGQRHGCGTATRHAPQLPRQACVWQPSFSCTCGQSGRISWPMTLISMLKFLGHQACHQHMMSMDTLSVKSLLVLKESAAANSNYRCGVPQQAGYHDLLCFRSGTVYCVLQRVLQLSTVAAGSAHALDIFVWIEHIGAARCDMIHRLASEYKAASVTNPKLASSSIQQAAMCRP